VRAIKQGGNKLGCLRFPELLRVSTHLVWRNSHAVQSIDWVCNSLEGLLKQPCDTVLRNDFTSTITFGGC